MSDPFWALIEADFHREYGLDLIEEYRRSLAGEGDALSWRSFLVRLRGLGRYSAWRDYRRALSESKGDRAEKAVLIEDPEAAERAFRDAFGIVEPTDESDRRGTERPPQSG